MSYWIAGAAALGAIADRKKPLRGALLGAGTMMTGGALAGAGAAGAGAAGAAGAGAGAAGAAGAGAAGTTAATGGLLGNAGAAATYGTGLGTQQTAMLAAQEAGMGAGGGILSGIKSATPAVQAAMNGVKTVQGMMPQEQQPQVAPLQQQPGFDASGLLSSNNQQLADLKKKRLARRGIT
jgi:hypothetical protein